MPSFPGVRTVTAIARIVGLMLIAAAAGGCYKIDIQQGNIVDQTQLDQLRVGMSNVRYNAAGNALAGRPVPRRPLGLRLQFFSRSRRSRRRTAAFSACILTAISWPVSSRTASRRWRCSSGRFLPPRRSFSSLGAQSPGLFRVDVQPAGRFPPGRRRLTPHPFLQHAEHAGSLPCQGPSPGNATPARTPLPPSPRWSRPAGVALPPFAVPVQRKLPRRQCSGVVLVVQP